MAADSLLARAGVKSLRIGTLQSRRRNRPIHHCPFAYSLVVFVYLNRRFPPVEINTREFKALRRRRARKDGRRGAKSREQTTFLFAAARADLADLAAAEQDGAATAATKRKFIAPRSRRPEKPTLFRSLMDSSAA